MVDQHFTRCKSDPCIYYKVLDNGEFVLLLLYVDDELVIDTNMSVSNLKQQLAHKFAMKDLGATKRILGMTIIKDRQKREIRLSQKNINNVLDKFNMKSANVVSTPLVDHFHLSFEMCPKTQEDQEYMKGIPYSSIVKSLMYVMVCTRPHIAHAMRVEMRFMSNPSKIH